MRTNKTATLLTFAVLVGTPASGYPALPPAFIVPFCTGSLEFDDVALVPKLTIDGRDIPMIENREPWGTWDYESPEAPFTLNENGQQIKVLITRVSDGAMQVQFHNVPTGARTAWALLSGTQGTNWSDSYTWTGAGTNVNGGGQITWTANTRTDDWDCWRGQFPSTNTAATPYTWGAMRIYADCLAAQASNWEIGILPVWYNSIESGSGIEHRDATLPNNSPPGALVHRWIPNDPAGAPGPYPRMESNDGEQSYPAQFLVQTDNPMTQAIETDWVVAGVFFDLPGVKPFYSMATPSRVFTGAGDQGNLVAQNERILFGITLTTVVKVDNAGDDLTTDEWGYRIQWSSSCSQTIGIDPPPLPGPNTVATWFVWNAIAYNMGDSPAQYELDAFNDALSAPRCWMWGTQADRQRIAGP